jgi:hypothetical protein
MRMIYNVFINNIAIYGLSSIYNDKEELILLEMLHFVLEYIVNIDYVLVDIKYTSTMMSGE